MESLFCRKFCRLSKAPEVFLIILPAEGALAPANTPYQMTVIAN